MPTTVGPNTYGEENLVFGYDLGDVSNSYKGEPTTNVVNYPQPTTGWGIANYNSTSTRSYGFDENGEPVLIIDVTVAGSGYPRSTGAYLSSNITGTFSTSFEARSDTDGTNIALKIYENGSTKVTNTANLTTQWQRFTFDNQSTGFSLNQPYFNPVNVGRYYIRKIQIEAKSHSTPFVNGTRSATQGLIDLTGNSTIDLTNVSFDSNAQMIFDGTNDYINTALTGVNLDSACTIEAVMKRFTTNTAWRTFFNIKPNGANTPFFEFRSDSYGQNIKANYYNGSTDYITGGAGFLTGQLYHAIATYDGAGNIRLYVDGVLRDTKTGVPAFSLGTSPQLTIGRAYSNDRYTDIDIPMLKIYNRALTASEVASNYKAIKGRFNI